MRKRSLDATWKSEIQSRCGKEGFLYNLILDVTSGLFLNCEKSLRGSIPKRKVATAIENRVITWRYVLDVDYA